MEVGLGYWIAVGGSLTAPFLEIVLQGSALSCKILYEKDLGTVRTNILLSSG